MSGFVDIVDNHNFRSCYERTYPPFREECVYGQFDASRAFVLSFCGKRLGADCAANRDFSPEGTGQTVRD
jgi:hypothetical protein